MSITQVEDSKNTEYSNINNAEVIEFNKKLKEEVEKISNSHVMYCNIYDKLEKGGYSTFDGLHYDSDTYKRIYQYIKEC